MVCQTADLNAEHAVAPFFKSITDFSGADDPSQTMAWRQGRKAARMMSCCQMLLVAAQKMGAPQGKLMVMLVPPEKLL